jgi:hypothetical protein
MTGTPRPNSELDLFPQVAFLDHGARLGKSWEQFRSKYFYPLDPDGWDWAPRKGAEAQIRDSIRDISYVMEPGDYLQLPPLIVQDIEVPMPAKAWDLYGRLEQELRFRLAYGQLEDAIGVELDNGATIRVDSPLALLGKLRQVTAGAIIDTKSGEVHAVHTAGFDAATEIIEALNGEPVIVVYAFKFQVTEMRRRYPNAQLLGSGTSAQEAERIINDWNTGKISVLLLHPRAAGHGVQLAAGGCHMIWMTPGYSSEEWDQTIARLHRQGQGSPVVVHRLRVSGSIDDTAISVVADKQSGQQALLNALKAKW